MSDGFSAEGPQGVLGGSIWDDPARWAGAVDGSTCEICVRGKPLGIVVERPTTWITSDRSAVTRGYLCIVARRHVLEPYELEGAERAAFWEDVLFAAERLARLVAPTKVNYEIHGNSLAHLHAHVYARYRGDRFVGGPIDTRLPLVDNVPLNDLRRALS
jgi:diadenosine tetraphosphate (Ap4A) HIT family hydrolase